MKIPSLQIENFLTIGSASLELDDRGLLLIQGINSADSSATSNGAGKSSAVDGLCWCLYGETARGVSGDEVVNRTAKKDTSVVTVIEDGEVQYRIERYRKHTKQKNQLLVWQILSPGTPPVALHKGTDRETQEVVNKIVGCGLDVFRGAIYAGQEMMPDLPGMTDKQLKLLIEEAAGVEELAEAYKEAGKRALVIEKSLVAAQTHVASLGSRLGALEGELTNSETEHASFETGRRGRALAVLAGVSPIETAIVTKTAELTALDEPTLTTEKAEVEARLAAVSGQQEELRNLSALERAAGDKVTRFRSTVEQLKTAKAKAEENLATVNSRVGTACGECSKTYCEHDLEKVKELRVNGVALAKKNLIEAVTSCRTAIEGHAATVKAVSDFQATMTDTTADAARLSVLTGQIATATRLTAQIAAHHKEIDGIKAGARAKLAEANPWTKAVESKKDDIERCKTDIATASTGVAELEDKLALANDVVTVFGPAGVRAHILDTVTPFLNEKTGEYLGALSDGNIVATWSTLSKTAKGELREKFNIAVTNDTGADSFKGLSGGEKRKVRLATNMALQDMVATRAEKPLGLWIGDEIDDALDEAGLERLMTILDTKAKSHGTVVVISHNSLADWIDNVITVEKTGGVSTITGANTRATS